MSESLDPGYILLKAGALFSRNFKLFIIFGVAGALLGGVLELVPNTSQLSSVILTVLRIIFALIQIRVTISLLLLIQSRLSGSDLSASEAWSESMSYYGNYFLTQLFLAFRIALVVIPFSILMSTGDNIAFQILGYVILFAGAIFVLLHYSFAPIMRVLNPEVNTPFATSYSLVKGHRLKVVSIFFIIGILTILLSLGLVQLPIPATISSIMNIVISVFVIPFSAILLVLVYEYLVDQLDGSNEGDHVVD